MVARVNTVAFRGIETLEIDVQVHIANTMPAVNIVGLPAKAVDESKDRVTLGAGVTGIGVPSAAYHRQSGAGRCDQGRQSLRSADRAWHSGGDGRGLRGRSLGFLRAWRVGP